MNTKTKTPAETATGMTLDQWLSDHGGVDGSGQECDVDFVVAFWANRKHETWDAYRCGIGSPAAKIGRGADDCCMTVGRMFVWLPPDILFLDVLRGILWLIRHGNEWDTDYDYLVWREVLPPGTDMPDCPGKSGFPLPILGFEYRSAGWMKDG